jgi:hypothetical protein
MEVNSTRAAAAFELELASKGVILVTNYEVRNENAKLSRR